MEEEWRESTFHEGLLVEILRPDALPVANQC